MALAAEGADCGDIGDTGETADFADTGETADFADTGETADFADTGETADFADTGETADFADTGETADFADNADCAEPATEAEASAFSAPRSTAENPCCTTLSCTSMVSLTGAIGWATATPAPTATTPNAPVMDQNVRDIFMAANLSFIDLPLRCFKHGQ